MEDKLAKGNALSDRVERFCELVAADPNHDVAKAYSEAGLIKGDPLIQGEALLSRPEVASRIRELAQEVIPALNFVENMRNRALCLDLWRGVVREKEWDGEPIPLKMKLEASALLARSCGLMASEKKEARPPAVNVNLGPATIQPAIQVCDPYAVPVGDGKTVDIVPVPGGFGGDGPDAN